MIMRTRKYKTLVGMLRATGVRTFSMDDFLSGDVYNAKCHEWQKIELSEEALRELSDGFCSALSCQKSKYDIVFLNMKFRRILNRGILSRLWVELRNNKPSFTYIVGQSGDVEYPLVRRILYKGY